MPPFDRTAAASLLDDAGWKRTGSGSRVADGVKGITDGTPLRFRFLSFPTFAQYGQLIKSQLGEVGMDVQLETLDPTPFADRVFVRRDFDTNVINYCNGTDPEIGVRRMYDIKQIGPVSFSNPSAYRKAGAFAVVRGCIDARPSRYAIGDLPRNPRDVGQ